MRKIVLLLSFSFFLITAFSQSINHENLKQVYVGAIPGDIYGFLDWNDDAANALKASGYSEENIQKIKNLVLVSNHPKHINSAELFDANKYQFHNFIAFEIVSFESLYAPENRNLKYKLLWIPFDQNQHLPEGIKPETKEGFYIVMHRMSVKPKQLLKENLIIITQEDLDALKKEKARIAAENQLKNQEYKERMESTYTVTYILEKKDGGLGSVRVFYSAVFIEVYDSNKSYSESDILKNADNEFRNNVQLNGYTIHKKYIEKCNSEIARNKVENAIELSDSKTFHITLN